MEDVIVLGAGLSGLVAAALALEQGARVRLIAMGIGSPLIAPGWISVADGALGNVLDGARSIAAEHPEHPYALAGSEALEGGIALLRRLGEAIGLPFHGDLSTNLALPTALGSVQTPALAPRGLARGDGQRDRALFVGIAGWRDFYPLLAGPRAAFIQLPGASGPWDATPTDLARRFDDPEVRKGAAAGVRHHLDGVSAVGFPAVLGYDDPLAAQNDLEDQIGLPVFELATLPPSVPGTRLFNRLRRYSLDRGMRIQIGHAAACGLIENGCAVGVEVAAAGKAQQFRAGRIILATGGLYGGGLASDDTGRIWEPIFDLPVQANRDREGWFADDLLAPEGHAVHRFGIRVNAKMQPLSAQGEPFAANLYAAGHLLAQPGQTPISAFAEGMALATAYKAVTDALRN